MDLRAVGPAGRRSLMARGRKAAQKAPLRGRGAKGGRAGRGRKKATGGKLGKKAPAGRRRSAAKKKTVEQYTHSGTNRPNNPPAGLADGDTDPDRPSVSYRHDPRMDPHLQWSGRQEETEFRVDTVSLHVHERIDPHTILAKAMKGGGEAQQTLLHYFDAPENNLPLRDAIEFYQHDQNWSNRLIAGDSLLVMNSLLEKEGMAGKVQMVYVDPPYGIKYKSNFQPYTNKTDVKDRRDDDLTQEPEMIKAFRDTWELGVHSYLSYLRKRLLLARQLLSDSGSVFVQISDQNLHHVMEIMSEVFGHSNFVSVISYRTTAGDTTALLPSMSDYIIWFAKDKKQVKFHKIFIDKDIGAGRGAAYIYAEGMDGEIRKLEKAEILNPKLIPNGLKVFRTADLKRAGFSNTATFNFEFDGKKYHPGNNYQWKTNVQGMERLKKAGWLVAMRNTLSYKRYFDDFPISELGNMWIHTQGATGKRYVVQTSPKVIQRCMMMSTDPGDLVFDPTCGGGTTASVAEQWGRRWITCDTSRVALALTRQRIMTARYEYYKLKRHNEGVSSGFEYRTIPHRTLESVANDRPPDLEVLYDQPETESDKRRISGPFTMEAVPAPTATSIDALSVDAEDSDAHHASAYHQRKWRRHLEAGIKAPGGSRMLFSSVLTHHATKWIHAVAITKEPKPRHVAVSFGPAHYPLERRQVERAIEEARKLDPRPEAIIFAAMQFDPEAAKDIDGIKLPWAGVLKAEMNKDLLTGDLKSSTGSESFWLIGQPDVDLKRTREKKYVVRVNGFDYYNAESGEVESGEPDQIAMWMLDTDYDGRSVYPQQVFFPIDGKGGGWERLGRDLKSHIDKDLIAKYRGTESIPFEAGPNKRAAVKIIDYRGVESLKLMDLD